LCLVQKGRFIIVKKAERKRAPLLANLGDFNRPVRVRPVRYLGAEWWAVDAEDTWPGIVMDLRRLGFESVALGEEVLVREPSLEPQMDSPVIPEGFKPFPVIHPTIRIRKTYATRYSDMDVEDIEDIEEEDDDMEEDDEFEPEDLDDDEE
jgi:hypothetical protein